jgi:hypothetical protein
MATSKSTPEELSGAALGAPVTLDREPSGKPVSIFPVADRGNPWVAVATLWNAREEDLELHASEIKLHKPDREALAMFVILPCKIPKLSNFHLHWDKTTSYLAEMEESKKLPSEHSSALKTLVRKTTYILLRSGKPRVINGPSVDYVACFAPSVEIKALEAWITAFEGRKSAIDVFKQEPNGPKDRIVWDMLVRLLLFLQPRVQYH